MSHDKTVGWTTTYNIVYGSEDYIIMPFLVLMWGLVFRTKVAACPMLLPWKYPLSILMHFLSSYVGLFINSCHCVLNCLIFLQFT